MTTLQRTRRERWPDVLARALTEALSPVVLAYVTCVTVSGVTAASSARGAGIGLVVATSCAGLPYALIVLASRKQALSGRHVPELRERPAVLAACAVSASVGLALAVAMGATRDVFALAAATIAGLVVAAGVSARWKLSIHMAAIAGALCAVGLLVTPWVLVAMPLLVALGWARTHLDEHTVAQVLGGALTGAVVTTVVVVALR